jgi:PAS domain S-box-containing protein
MLLHEYLRFIILKIMGIHNMNKPNKNNENCQERLMNTNFEEIFSQSPIGIFFYDKDGRLTNANDSALKIARIPKLDDVLGINIFENPLIASKKEELHEKGQIKFQDSLDLIQIKEQKIYNPIKPKIIDIDWTISVTDSGYMVQIQDITNQKLVEDSLKKSESTLRSFFDATGDMRGIVDVVSNNDVRHIADNVITAEYVGTTPNMMRNKLGSELGEPQEILSKWIRYYKESECTGKPVSFEYLDERENKEAWLVATVNYVGTNRQGQPRYAYVVRDITEGKKAEEKNIKLYKELDKIRNDLQAERDLLFALVSNIPDEVWFADKEKKFRLVNPSALQEFGLYGQNIDIEKLASSLEVYRPDGSPRPVDEAPPLRALKGEKIQNFEEIVRTPSSKELRYRQINASPVKDNNGNIIGAVSVVRDITESKKSEDKTKRVLESIVETYSEFDNEWRFVDVNNQIEKTYNMNRNELIGKVLWDVFPELIGSKQYKMFCKAKKENEPNKFESQSVISGHWYEVNVYPHSEGISVYSHDITERKKVEEKLKSNEEMLRLAQEAGNVGVWDWNLETGEVKWTPELESIYGLKPGSVSTYNDFESHIHPDDIKIVETRTNEAVDKHNSFEFEFRILKPTAEKRWVLCKGGALYDESGRPTRIFGVNIDITKQKKDEEEIQNRQKVLDAINRVFEEYLKTDTLNDVVQKCLELAQELTESEFGFFGEINENGRLDDRALSPPAWDVCETQNAHERLKNMEIVSYWGRTIKEEKSQIVNDPISDPDSKGLPEGHPPITSFLGVPLKDEGKTIGMIALANKKNGYNEKDKNNIETLGVAFVEVLLRKKAEIEKGITLKNLAQSNKELEQFSYITSHDLREPLRMITSFLQLLERRYQDQLDQDANEFIGFAIDGAKRLDAMTNDLLQYSRITNEKRELVQVNFEHVLENALANLKLQIEENNVIITHDPLPTIKGDEQLKIQLFQNIIGNAIKYRSQETPKIHISATRQKNQYLFSIKDNGIGMSPKHLEKIFTIFKRLHLHEEYEGTGIGLAIAQRIVHQQGGQIWAESEPGKGSTFYFTIPYQ